MPLSGVVTTTIEFRPRLPLEGGCTSIAQVEAFMQVSEEAVGVPTTTTTTIRKPQIGPRDGSMTDTPGGSELKGVVPCCLQVAMTMGDLVKAMELAAPLLRVSSTTSRCYYYSRRLHHHASRSRLTPVVTTRCSDRDTELAAEESRRSSGPLTRACSSRALVVARLRVSWSWTRRPCCTSC